jgi:serine/threonine-protein kinase
VERKLFGAIASDFHFITNEQLEEALEIQKALMKTESPAALEGHRLVAFRELRRVAEVEKRIPKIGEILVAVGYLKPHQVDVVLREQNKRIIECLACGASLNIGSFSPGQKVRCGQCESILLVVKNDSGQTQLSEIEEEEEAVPLDPATATRELEAELARRKGKVAAKPPEKKAPGKSKPSGPPVIGDFQLISKLGQDSTGIIYKAKQLSRERLVALKVMNAATMEDKEFSRSFFEGAKKAAALVHPNIKKTYAVGKADSKNYIAMEYVEAESVHNILQKQGRIHYETGMRIMTKVVEALDYAYENRLIHGDIRPSNLLVLKNGEVRLANLGLATKTTENILAIARSGRMAPFYLAPEQVTDDRQLDARTDIYSVGATLYHMLSGRPPFQGQSPFEVLIRLTEETIPPLKVYDPLIPDSICRIVEKMLQVEPEDRFQSYAELLAAMHDYDKVSLSPLAALRIETPEHEEPAAPVKPAAERRPPSAALKQAGSAVFMLAIAAIIFFIVKAILSDFNARVALEKARRNQRENFRDHDSIVRQYEEVIDKWPGTSYSRDAQNYLKAYHHGRYQAHLASLVEVIAMAKSYEERGDICAALGELNKHELPDQDTLDSLYSFAEENGKAAKTRLEEMDKLKKAFSARIDSDLAAIIQKALADADAANFTAAKERLQAAQQKFQQEALLTKLKNALDEVERKKSEYEKRSASAAQEDKVKVSETAYREACEKIAVAMKACAYETAMKRARESLEKLLPQHAEPLRQQMDELEALCRVKRSIMHKFDGWRDRMWTEAHPDPRPIVELDAGNKYRVTEADADRVVFVPASGGDKKFVPWVDLPQGFFPQLATMASEDGRARDHFDLGILFLRLGLFGQAEQQLQRARALGEDVSHYASVVEEHYAKQAETALSVADKSFNSGDHAEALKNLIVLKAEHSRREFVRQRVAQIDKMIESIFRKRIGREVSSEKSRFFPFDTEEELSEWQVLEGAWRVKDGRLEGYGKTAKLTYRRKNMAHVIGLLCLPQKKTLFHVIMGDLELRFTPERDSLMCLDAQGGKSKSDKFIPNPLSLHVFQVSRDGQNVSFSIDGTMLATFQSADELGDLSFEVKGGVEKGRPVEGQVVIDSLLVVNQ